MLPCVPSVTHADKLPHLYTLVVRHDNSFSILIDGDSVKEGSLLEDMAPSVNPPKVKVKGACAFMNQSCRSCQL